MGLPPGLARTGCGPSDGTGGNLTQRSVITASGPLTQDRKPAGLIHAKELYQIGSEPLVA
jgi:hypothetical protein